MKDHHVKTMGWFLAPRTALAQLKQAYTVGGCPAGPARCQQQRSEAQSRCQEQETLAPVELQGNAGVKMHYAC